MAEQVEYELSLKDLMIGKLKEADGAANKLESTMGSLGRRITHVAEAFGISFALFKGIEFIHSSTEAYEKLEFAQSQVEAGLESTGHAAGLTFEELKKGAEDLSHRIKFTQADVMQMQSVLLTFPSVTKETFGSASQAIIDMSTRLGQSLESSAIQVGKALQDPERGITALRRVGVNFNETQTEMVKRMVATGHQAQAQAFILKELQTEFGNSAEAAANADVTFRFNKSIEELKFGLGEAADRLLEYVTPALEFFVDTLKSGFHWLQDNKETLKGWAIALGIIVGPLAIVTAATYAWTIASTALATALEGVAAVIDLILANPIALAIGAISLAVYYCYTHFAKFRAVLWATWEVIKEFASIVGDIFVGLWHTIHGVFTINPAEITTGMMKSVDAVKGAAERLGKAAKEGWDAGMADFAKSKTEGAPKDVTKKATKAAAAPPPTVTPEAKGAKGQKNITITVNIGNLVKELSVRTTNITEGTAKVREMVTQALISATNDSQLIAGQ